MTPNFHTAFEHLIGIEGGYVNDPTDRGGETKYGISKKAYPNLDIRNLTLDGAKAIYYRDYWQKLKLDEIPSYHIAAELFDTGVNMGIGVASRFLQQALNLMNRNQQNFPDLIVDGVIGANTLNAYRKVDTKILLKVLNGLQFSRYVDIVTKNPSQEKYFNGWMQRV